MQKGKGFFRLVVAISILVYFLVFFIVFINLESEYYEPKKPTKLTPMEIEWLPSKPNYSELNDFYNLAERERRKVLAAIGKERQYLVDFYKLSETEKEEVLSMLTSKKVEPEPTGEHILSAMFAGVVAVIPIWIIYGLTIFVVKGFKGKEKRGENE